MKIKFWGVRGSTPSPLKSNAIEEKLFEAILGMPDVDTNDPQAVRAYINSLPPLQRGTAGGNTACVEIQTGNETIIIDAGSGLRDLGLELMKGPCGRGQGTIHFLFSHAHWDHIQGFPFFVPAVVPGNRIIIYSVHDLNAALRDQQRPLNFPVPLTHMQADIEFKTIQPEKPFSIGQLRINTIENAHPGKAYSYRLEDQHNVFVHASDIEFKKLDEITLQPYLEFFRDADVLNFDAQYTLQDVWHHKIDWGHSSAMIGVDLARAAGVKKLILFHHDPAYSDAQLQEIQVAAASYQAQYDNRPACEIIVAYEGLTLDLTPVEAVNFKLSADGRSAILTPATLFDETGVAQLLKQVSDLESQDPSTRSIIDLSRIERLTTASLKALVTTDLARLGETTVVVTPSTTVQQVIELAGFGDFFAIYPTIEAALAARQAREPLNLPGQRINARYQNDQAGQSTAYLNLGNA
jgi:phosphoribosyl 1,2-cyclic phosphodiesterase/anti-anti-sigma regulatory factor